VTLAIVPSAAMVPFIVAKSGAHRFPVRPCPIDLVRRQGVGDEVALRDVATQVAQDGELGFTFDAFGWCREPEGFCQGYDGGDEDRRGGSVFTVSMNDLSNFSPVRGRVRSRSRRSWSSRTRSTT
jgi:hypothetical protein